jgi:hypothetical protein
MGGTFLTDDFYHGMPLQVGLQRFGGQLPDPEFELKILPLRQDAPIYLPAGTRPAFPPGGAVAELQSVEVVPEYEVVMDLKP